MNNLFSFILLLCSQFLFGQTNYVKEITLTSGESITDFFISGGATLSDNSLSLYISPFNNLLTEDPFILIKLSPTGNLESAYSIGTNTLYSSQLNSVYGVDKCEEKDALVYRGHPQIDSSRSALIVMDEDANTIWGKQFYPDLKSITTRESISFSNSGNSIITSYYHDYFTGDLSAPKLGLYNAASQNGESIFHYYYHTVFPQNFQRYYSDQIISRQDEGFSILGKTETWNDFVLKIDSLGNPLFSTGIEDTNVSLEQHAIDQFGNTLVIGRYLKFPQLGLLGHTAILAKFDSSLNLLWSKELNFDFFPCDLTSVGLYPDGSIFFVVNSVGTYPIVIGNISSEGDLVWQKGFSLGHGQAIVKSNGSAFFTNNRKYLSNGDQINALIVASLDSLGELNDCPQIDACLEVVDIDLSFQNWIWEKEPSLPPWDIEVHSQAIDLLSNDYCQTPILPDPFFSISDSICINDCLTPSNVNNESANHVEWQIVGLGIDTLVADTTFSFCFLTAGVYTISQEIWLLGCHDFYEQEITILSEPETTFNTDGLICDDDFFDLTITGNRKIQNYEWSTGDFDEHTIIENSGTYGVTISDGVCVVTDSIQLVLVSESLEDSIFSFPNRIVICIDSLPYNLQITSPYSNDFSAPSLEIDTNNIAEITTNGTYAISTEIENCSFSKELVLITKKCEDNVYLPNSFSPDNNNINDYYEPLAGEEFEIIQLTIYNRWGAVVFNSKGPPHSWDGKLNNMIVQSGVYVGTVRYRNLRSGQIGFAYSDITVLK